MFVYSFEVGDDSDASTPGTEYMGSFTVTQIYRTDEASFATGRSNHDPRTPAFPEIKTFFPRKFHLPNGWSFITGSLLAIACGIAAFIAFVAFWCIFHCVRQCWHPTLPPNSGPQPPIVVCDPHVTSHALNLDGSDLPPSLVIEDENDTPRAVTQYFSWLPASPTRLNWQMVEHPRPEVSPLLTEPEASTVNLDAFMQQPVMEIASHIPLAAHSEGSDVAKEILYGDGVTDRLKPTRKNSLEIDGLCIQLSKIPH